MTILYLMGLNRDHRAESGTRADRKRHGQSPQWRSWTKRIGSTMMLPPAEPTVRPAIFRKGMALLRSATPKPGAVRGTHDVAPLGTPAFRVGRRVRISFAPAASLRTIGSAVGTRSYWKFISCRRHWPRLQRAYRSGGLQRACRSGGRGTHLKQTESPIAKRLNDRKTAAPPRLSRYQGR